jgi:hypothetical protein
MNVRAEIERRFVAALEGSGAPTPAGFSDEMILLESGLDSLGFAVLVARLEQDLGYDPFSLMEEAVYPRTFGDFVAIYERFKDHAGV